MSETERRRARKFSSFPFPFLRTSTHHSQTKVAQPRAQSIRLHAQGQSSQGRAKGVCDGETALNASAALPSAHLRPLTFNPGRALTLQRAALAALAPGAQLERIGVGTAQVLEPKRASKPRYS